MRGLDELDVLSFFAVAGELGGPLLADLLSHDLNSFIRGTYDSFIRGTYDTSRAKLKSWFFGVIVQLHFTCMGCV